MLVEILKSAGAIKYGDFILASGKKSNYYIDIKTACCNPTVLDTIAKTLATKIHDLKLDLSKVAGTELGGVPIAVALSLKLNIPYLIIRKDTRTHGTRKQIEGELVPKDKVAIIEDVTTTGNSLLRAINILRDADAEVKVAFTIVDREEGATQLLTSENIHFIPLVCVSELLRKS